MTTSAGKPNSCALFFVLASVLVATQSRANTITPDQTITEAYFCSGVSGSISYLGTPGQLDFAVDGRINSITIMPSLKILETGQSVVLPFGFAPMFSPNAANPPQWSTAFPNGSPMTIQNVSDDPHNPYYPVASDSLHLSFGDNQGDSLFFGALYSYEKQNGFPKGSFQLGLELTSVDYTPSSTDIANVPDASSTAVLLAAGLFGVLCAARKIDSRDHGSPLK